LTCAAQQNYFSLKDTTKRSRMENIQNAAHDIKPKINELKS
jgi:hypothetical protein